MIIESITIIFFALVIDLTLGDPKNKFHPTAWMGSLIGKFTPLLKNSSANLEKLGGIILIVILSTITVSLLSLLGIGINLITVDYFSIIVSIIISGILLKTTIAIKGMEKHALAVVTSLENNNIASARDNLSMIVKRNTKDLDKNHVLSGVVESIQEWLKVLAKIQLMELQDLFSILDYLDCLEHLYIE
jgi:adenosylcobinamide-phosphate synthase